MTRSEYLESKGFHHHDYDGTWVNGYYDVDSVVGVLDFNAKYGYGYKITINNYDIFDGEDLESLQDGLSELRDIYYKAYEMEDK